MKSTCLHCWTPLIESVVLTARSGCTTWLKLDAVQPSGSFKIRGIGLACQEYRRLGARRFVSSSGGNAGLAVAYAARRLGLPATVVVPETTTERAMRLIRQEAAEVVVHGASWQDADALARSLLKETDAYLHPFDDALVWRGHSTIIDEISALDIKPDAVVLSVGGGGLLCGVVEGLRRIGWDDIPVVAVETAGADSLHRSIAAGERIELAAITSIATSLGARRVCEQAFRLTREHDIRSLVVSDKQALEACLSFLSDHRIVVEPACGAALAPLYAAASELSEYRSIVAVVCGGATATLEHLQSWLREQTD